MKYCVIALFALWLCSNSVVAENQPHPLTASDLARLSPLFIGETHGSKNVAEFAVHVMERVDKSQQVAILLELPGDMNADIQAFFSETANPSTLWQNAFWARSFQDGRSSQAMFDLIATVKHRKSLGYPVTLYAFDARRDKRRRDVPREIIMAENISEFLSASRADVTLIISGRVHANKSLNLKDGTPTVANQLRHKHTFTALDMVTADGSYWACFRHPVKKFDCGVKPVTGNEAQSKRYSADGVYLPDTSREGFDGVLYFKTSVHSLPARRPSQGSVEL